MKRREFLISSAAASLGLLPDVGAWGQGASPAKFTLPPVDENPSVTRLIDEVASALKVGKSPGDILTDATFMPAHFHVEIEQPEVSRRAMITEILFDNDPRLTPEMTRRAQQDGFIVAKIDRVPQSPRCVHVDFKMG